ncbi:MAG: hypothetical protein ACHP7O_08275, partial [Burkholderiales bacterium]
MKNYTASPVSTQFFSLLSAALFAVLLGGCGGSTSSSDSSAANATSKQFTRSDKKLTDPNAVQTLFVAYFGRPAAPAGLAYWLSNGQSLDQVGSYFSHSPELLNQITGLDPNALTQSTASALVTNFFVNLFGRQPLPAGLAYWTNALQTGAITINNLGTTLVANASSGDRTTIADKVAVANYFTSQLTATSNYNSTTFAAAKAMMSAVTASTFTTAAAYQTTVNATIASLSAPVAGSITTVAGGGSVSDYSFSNIIATTAEFYAPAGVAVDGSGNIYIADTSNGVIGEVNAATGIITALAGNYTNDYSGDGGPATAAMLNEPYG